MSSQSPEEIRAEIERTRAALSNDVDALAEDDPQRQGQEQQDEVARESRTGEHADALAGA